MSLGFPLQPDADPPTRPGDDLAWDAFCYIADALTPPEVSRFEERLGHDQAAREAVAAAVDQFGAIAAVLDPVAATATRPLQTRSRRSRYAAAVLLAAALVLGATTCWVRFVVRPGSSELALAWTSIRAEHSTADGTTPLAAEPNPVEPVAGADPVAPDAALAEIPAERPVPSWMVAAVAPRPVPDETPTPEGN